MTRIYPEFDSARATREETLAKVAGMSQKESEQRPEEGKWSAGEVLDHLLKLDVLVVRELDVTLRRRRRGLPFVYRSLADVEPSIPTLLRPVLPFFEIPFSLANAAFPPRLRRYLTGNRSLPLQAPKILAPRFGRPLEVLRQELAETFDTLAQQQADNPDVNLNYVLYYNPVVGLNNVPGMYKFIANHERRHQQQLDEVLAVVAVRPAA